MTKAASAPPSVASLPERLREAMNEARKNRDQARTLLLSTVLADIKNRELELHHPASDEETVEVVRRAIRRRHEAAEQRSEEHTSELQSRLQLVCRLLLGKKNVISSLGGKTSYIVDSRPLLLMRSN